MDDVDRLAFEERYEANKTMGKSFVVISTYTSFCRERTFNMLNQFDRKKVLLIADECHNMGSGRMLKAMPLIHYGRRIGLSATPNRQYDERGNNAIRKFFNVDNDNYTYEYTMKQAIDNGIYVLSTPCQAKCCRNGGI